MPGLFDDVLQPERKSRAKPAGDGLFDDVLRAPDIQIIDPLDPESLRLQPASRLGDAVTEEPWQRGARMPITNDPNLQFDGYQAQADGSFVPVPVADPWVVPPKTTNPLEGARARVYDLLGSGIRGVANVGERLGDIVETALPISGLTPEQIANEQQLSPLFRASDYLREQADAVGYAPAVGMPAVKSALYEPITGLGDLATKLGTAGRFALDQGLTSTPDMAAAVATLPAYVLVRTQEIGERRVANDGRTGEPMLGDLAAALPAAAIESTLERFATRGLGRSEASTVLGRIASELGLQTGTESVEEVIANLGESLGTERGVDKTELGEAALGGALGGVTVGGGGAVAGEVARAAASRPEAVAAAKAEFEEAVRAAPQQWEQAAATAAERHGVTPEDILTTPDTPAAAPAASDLDELLLRNLPPDVIEAAADVPPEALGDVLAAVAEQAQPEPSPPAAEVSRWQRPESAAPPAPTPALPASSPVTAEAPQILAQADAPAASTAPPEALPAQPIAEPAEAQDVPDASSWIVRNKATGEVVMETYDRKKVDALNTAKYEAVPVLQHLQELNDPSTPAYRAARGEPATPAPAPTGQAVPPAAGPAPEAGSIDAQPQIDDDTPEPATPILYGKRRAAQAAEGEPSARAQARVDRMFGSRTEGEAPVTESVRQGEADADALGLRESVRTVLGDAADRVEFLRDHTGLPDRLRTGVTKRLEQRDGKGQPAALYDTATQRVYVFTGVSNTPEKAAFQAAHEIAGHHGLRALLGDKLDHALSIALQNPTVRDVADGVAKQRNLRGDQRMLAAEEALADLAAAVRTGRYDEITARYGVVVPEGMQESISRTIENFLRRLKEMFDDLFGRHVFSDEDVRSLLEAAWKAAQGEGESMGDQALESVDYTPAQTEALAKAGIRVERRTTLTRIRDNLREEWSKLRDAARNTDALKQATFDKFHGLRMAEAQLGLTDPEQSPYIAARMSAGIGSNMEGLMLYGAPKWDGGVLAIDSNTVGLLDALKPVEGKIDDFLGWMVGRRAKLLKSQGRENNLSDADIAALLSLAQGNEAAFQKAATDYLKIKNAVLDVAEQAGLIDPVARAAWDHAEYIPFYRQDGDHAVGPGTRRGLAGQSSGIKTLKGGEQALADPLANIVRNFAKLLDAANKNRATLLAVDRLGGQFFKPAPREMQPATIPLDQVKRHLRDQGVPDATIDGMPPAALKGVQRMLSIVPPTGEDVVRVMREGKAEYYRVLDPLVLRALTAFKAANKNMAIKPFIWFKRLLTMGVTTTAEFVGANFIRDSGSAWVISDDRFIPGWDSLKGIGNTLRNDPGTRDMMMAGATFLGGNFYDGNADSAAAAIRRALRKKKFSSKAIQGFMDTVPTNPLQLWDKWLTISGAVENANRRAVYDAALKSGRTKTEAAYMARDLMDFSMQGDAQWVQFFSDVLPFFNARLQGMYKLGRRAGTPEGRRAIVLRGGVLVMASAALYAWNMAMHGDAYDDLEEWDKDAYWHVAPGTEHHVRIPKPFELGLIFGTAPERMMQAIRNVRSGDGDKPSATWNSLVRALTGTLAMNPIPQAALPVMEQWANKRFFTDRAIENMGDEKLLPEARAEWYTSDTAKAISGLVGNETGLSPKRLEHLWNGYTAGLGGYVLDASDAIVRMAQGAPERPEMSRKDWLVLGRFLRGGSPGSTKYTEQFYDRLREAEQIEQTIKEYTVIGRKDDAAELERENADILGARIANKAAKGGFQFTRPKALRKVRGELSEIREQIEDIALDRKLSDHDKRVKIDELTAQRNRMVKDAVTGKGPAPDTGVMRSSLPESRRAEYIGIGNGGQATAAPDVLKGAKNAPKLVMVGDYSGIENAEVRQSFDEGAQGVFDPDTKTAYVVVGLEPAAAKWTAYHEIAGHYGLQGALGDDYEAVLNRARQNPLVKELADKMHAAAYKKQPNRLVLTEEALSELAAARKTGDYAVVEDRWGVKIPDSAKPGLGGMLRRVAQMTKRTLADLTGEEPDAYDDDQVYELIEDAWKYVER